MKKINFKKLTAKTLISIMVAGSLVNQAETNKAVASSSSSPPASISLTGTIRDFQDNHPDFESTTGNDRNIVTLDLGEDKKPIYADHPNDSTHTTNGKANFDQWYRDVEGINKRKEHTIELTLQDDGTYKYQNNQFFPINGELWGNYRDNKNYHFTYELHTKFTYEGGEVFTFSGDDDVWVYIDGKRVIDIGGVHTSQTESVSLDSLDLVEGEAYDLDFFFAERHYSQSNFTITTSIELETVVNPDAINDTITTDEDSSVTANILDNDLNPNNDLSLNKITINGTEQNIGSEITLESGALLKVESNGQTTYNPNNKFENLTTADSLSDKFTYTVIDSNGNTDTADVTMKITGVADAPVATDDIATTNENTSTQINVLANDNDPDSDSDQLKVSQIKGEDVSAGSTVNLTSGASITLNADGTLTYDPTNSQTLDFLNDGDTEDEVFSYQVSDEYGNDDTGNVTVTVTGITDTYSD